jgi:hypothetical protein
MISGAPRSCVPGILFLRRMKRAMKIPRSAMKKSTSLAKLACTAGERKAFRQVDLLAILFEDFFWIAVSDMS